MTDWRYYPGCDQQSKRVHVVIRDIKAVKDSEHEKPLNPCVVNSQRMMTDLEQRPT